MAAPSNLNISPSSVIDTNLPSSVTITGTDIFERPDYTDRELFTQVGSNGNLVNNPSLSTNPDTGNTSVICSRSNNAYASFIYDGEVITPLGYNDTSALFSLPNKPPGTYIISRSCIN